MLREHVSVFATRWKQENCPFHFGFMVVAILVMLVYAITNSNLLPVAERAPYFNTKAVLSSF
jgi:hypothetical protein